MSAPSAQMAAHVTRARNRRLYRALERVTVCACGAHLAFDTDRDGLLVETCYRCRRAATAARRMGDPRICTWEEGLKGR